MQRFHVRKTVLAMCVGLALIWVSSAAWAQSYHLVLLTSDISGKAKHTDGLLRNAWGITYAPSQPFWISDEADGWSTLYNSSGTPQSLQVIIPPASGTGSGKPTGIVYNGSQEFQINTWPSEFIFATLDGSISGWSHFNPSSALIGATQAGASYTGLAITNRTTGNLLYAADAANNHVDVYNASFSLVQSFTDPATPTGFAPFGIQDIGGQLYVTYASTSGGNGGFVDIFKEDGTFVKRLVHGLPLNQPWGSAVAPSNFGPLSGDLLVSNNAPGGTINAFSLSTGKFVSAIKNSLGKAFVVSGLWGLKFGGGSAANGQTNQLFFTAGPNDTDGFFGVIFFK